MRHPRIFLALAFALLAPAYAFAETDSSRAPLPFTAHQLLDYARQSIIGAEGQFDGVLRRKRDADPFVADFGGDDVTYYFKKDEPKFPNHSLRVVPGGDLAGKTTSEMTQAIRNSDVTWEDLSLTFLGWPPTGIEDDQLAIKQAYRVTVVNPDDRGAYSSAIVWIHQKTLGLLKIEAFDRNEPDNFTKEIKIWGYKKHGDQWLPNRVVITTREQGKKISSTSIEINEERKS